MSKFTVGEWKVIRGAGIDELDVISEEERNICCVFGYSVSRRNEQKANGRLIAAAPEMYKLLTAVANYKPDIVWDVAFRAKELQARIDGEEAEHEVDKE